MLKAILILPFNVLVTIPAVILYFCQFDIISPAFSLELILMLFLLVLGFFLVIWTMRLFAAVGKGTPAPWDPIDKLIVTGPYAYVRNPMLSGVFCILFAEALRCVLHFVCRGIVFSITSVADLCAYLYCD